MRELLVLLSLLWACNLSGQQLPLFTQYSENRGLINPASIHPDYFLKDYNANIGITHRSQWNAIPNHPETTAIRAEVLSEAGGSSILAGAYIIRDQAGPISQTGVYGRFNFINTSDYSNKNGFALGLLGGIVQYRINGTQRLADDVGDPTLLEAELATTNAPDIGLGVSFFQELKNRDVIYIGASVPQILNLTQTFTDENSSFDFSRIRHYYGTASYYRFLGEVSHLELSAWVRYLPGVPINYDGNLRYRMSDLMYIGVGWNSAGLGHFEAGFYLGESINLYDNQIKLGYSYDPAFNRFGFSFGNTHEFTMSYSFDY